MLLVIDAGNTNIVGGVYDGDRLIETLRMQTVPEKTEDEYSVVVKSILEDRGIDSGSVSRVILSSVVPALTRSIVKMARHLFDAQAAVVGPEVYDRLPLTIPARDEIGTDLVANALAAWEKTGGSAIVVDFGTALSFTSVNAAGVIMGVSIAPGLNTAMNALTGATAQLPSVPIVAPPSIFGMNTVQAIQSGVVFGYTGLVEYLSGRLKAELGGAKIIATGGLCHAIEPHTKVFDMIEPNLTLEGLARMERYLFL